jgi:DNA-directed RNA polymerase
MSELASLVKEEFLKIYVDMDFLKTLRDNLLRDLKLYRIEIKEVPINKRDKEYYAVISRKNRDVLYKIPRLPKKGDLIIEDIRYSKYMIC